jgi:hypothetical protein
VKGSVGAQNIIKTASYNCGKVGEGLKLSSDGKETSYGVCEQGKI